MKQILVYSGTLTKIHAERIEKNTYETGLLTGTLICCHIQFFSLELVLFEHDSVLRVKSEVVNRISIWKQINYA